MVSDGLIDNPNQGVKLQSDERLEIIREGEKGIFYTNTVLSSDRGKNFGQKIGKFPLSEHFDFTGEINV